MAVAGGNFNQYHDNLANQPVGGRNTQDVLLAQEATRKLRLSNDGVEINQAQQKQLFWVILLIVIVSVAAIIVINAFAAIEGTHLEAAVLISFNAAIAVQSFLLLGVLARSLFPTSASGQKENQEPTP